MAVLLGNRLEYPEVAAGIAKAGLVMVPLNPRLTPTEAGYILDHSGASALVLDDALAAVVGDAVADGPAGDAVPRRDAARPVVRRRAGRRVGSRPDGGRRRGGPVLHRLHLGHDRDVRRAC